MAVITQKIFGVHTSSLDSVNSEEEHFYNPFSIKAASDNFSKSQDPLASKILIFTRDAFLDLAVNNPYKMSVGNIQTAFKNRYVQKWLLEKVSYYTEVTALVLGSLIYIAALSFLGGAVLKGGGLALQQISSSSICVFSGKILFNGGEYIQKTIAKTFFMSGTVPLYAAFYRLPKWVITSVVPEGMKLAWKGMKASANALEKTAEIIFQNVIVPFVKILQNVTIFVWNHIIEPIVRTIGRIVVKGLEWAANCIADFITKTWNTVIIPFARTLKSIISSLWNHVIEPIGRMLGKGLEWTANRISDVITWTWNELIVPFAQILKNVISSLWNHVIEPIGRVIEKGLEWTANRIADIINWTLDNIMQPLLVGLESLSKFLWQHVIVPLADITEKGFDMCIKAASTVISYVLDYFLLPIWQLIKGSSLLVWEYVVQPFGKCLGSAVISLADIISYVTSKIFHNLIQPVAQAFSYTVVQLANFISESCTSLYNAIARVYSAVFG